jgi:endonuclease/exonuclease/phosphatase (EEP) superfamily protein YafD
MGPASYANERTSVVATAERASPRDRRAPPSAARWVVPLLLAAAPWGWFAIRDLGPGMDPIAVGLPVGAMVLAIATFAVAMLSDRMRFALVSLSLVTIAGVVVLAPRLPRSAPAPVDPFRLVSANTYQDNPDPRAAARALVAARPDVLVAVETPVVLQWALRADLNALEHVKLDGLNVFARWPLGEPDAIGSIATSSAIRVEVDRPGAPFVLYVVHLPNPLHEVSFREHASLVEDLLRAALSEHRPVVLAGDFNMSDRSTSYRMLDGAMRDAMRSSLAGSTYQFGLWGLLQLRIDHVFVSRETCAAGAGTFGVPGSDHEGLDVLLGRCP